MIDIYTRPTELQEQHEMNTTTMLLYLTIRRTHLLHRHPGERIIDLGCESAKVTIEYLRSLSGVERLPGWVSMRV